MIKQFTIRWVCCLLFCFMTLAWADKSPDLLPPEQAFQFSTKAKQTDRVALSWDIADGYYLYRHKFKFKSLTSGITLKEANFPSGVVKQDKFFGEVEVYKHHLEVTLLLQRQDPKLTTLVLEVGFQGCAEVGVCYMPMQQTVTLDLSDEHFNWWGMTDRR
jgi:thioredoxin:protein disulfide reductase